MSMVAAMALLWFASLVFIGMTAAGAFSGFFYNRFREYEQTCYTRRDWAVERFKERETAKMHRRLARKRFLSAFFGKVP